MLQDVSTNENEVIGKSINIFLNRTEYEMCASIFNKIHTFFTPKSQALYGFLGKRNGPKFIK